jgi:hypothetical protein
MRSTIARAALEALANLMRQHMIGSERHFLTAMEQSSDSSDGDERYFDCPFVKNYPIRLASASNAARAIVLRIG